MRATVNANETQKPSRTCCSMAEMKRSRLRPDEFHAASEGEGGCFLSFLLFLPFFGACAHPCALRASTFYKLCL